ncbi:hypothetical protein H696_00617 [Fonticula alba]|uniref:CHY-type domain-containing protein n=1 Tax=Fonticula alba TaxID=691883 RepID=A0A058ZGI1_FONAL|nr:hypothetical protein H696_00617 [Fonticula alba]KCV73071.1 hypothetical protein H696_00617 [Fonticula alba]|eukprot:XP_009492772.1 hypothetical protein H696_00617 [Fonticula alba]
MCVHILNAQVSIRAPCCKKKWFDCAECHAAVSNHELHRSTEMVFACKKCRKVFRKDLSEYEEADEFCPHCDNQYIIPAKTPMAGIGLEGDDPRLVRDDRQRDRRQEDRYR